MFRSGTMKSYNIYYWVGKTNKEEKSNLIKNIEKIKQFSSYYTPKNLIIKILNAFNKVKKYKHNFFKVYNIPSNMKYAGGNLHISLHGH